MCNQTPGHECQCKRRRAEDVAAEHITELMKQADQRAKEDVAEMFKHAETPAAMYEPIVPDKPSAVVRIACVALPMIALGSLVFLAVYFS